MQGHTNRVWSVAFDASGSQLASGSEDGTIKLWEVATGVSRVLRSPRPYEGMDITGIAGLSEAQVANLKSLGASETVGSEHSF